MIDPDSCDCGSGLLKNGNYTTEYVNYNNPFERIAISLSETDDVCAKLLKYAPDSLRVMGHPARKLAYNQIRSLAQLKGAGADSGRCCDQIWEHIQLLAKEMVAWEKMNISSFGNILWPDHMADPTPTEETRHFVIKYLSNS
jgi:hypothetical protein